MIDFMESFYCTDYSQLDGYDREKNWTIFVESIDIIQMFD